MSLLIVSAKALGTLIGYTINLEAIRAAKEGVKKLVVDDEPFPDELVQAIVLMESGEFTCGVGLLKQYRSDNASSSSFRVVKELYVDELQEIEGRLANIIGLGSVLIKGPAYQIRSQGRQLLNTLSEL